MILLGLLLVVAGAAFGVELFVSNNAVETPGEAFGQAINNLSAGGYALLGAAITVAIIFGVLLIDSGARQARKRKLELEEAQARQVEAARQAESEKAAAVSEAERLRDELTEERMSQATLGGVVMPPDIESPGELPVTPAEPVDDPEHAQEDHRGILGRIRGDRGELAEPAAAPPVTPAPRPEVATDAFRAAMSPAPEEQQPSSG